MFEIDLIAEADRQFTVCNACRYCEGFCAVFPAAEARSTFGTTDVAYLANLCNDCRMCFDACPFTPPHEYAINIPALLAQARVETYEHYSWPRELGRLFRAPYRGTAVVAVAALVLLLAAVLVTTGGAALLAPHVGPGAFYRIVSFASLVTGALLLTVGGAIVTVLGILRFGRDIAVFDAGWSAFAQAAREALALTYLRGGGAGCYDEKRGSASRRVLHGLVFWGFLSDIVSTSAAAVEQDLLGILPPFPLASVPVIFGTIGGIGILIGACGLLLLKRRSDPAPTADRSIALDITFLVVLALVALSGLLLLVFRTTAIMGTLLTVHLAMLAAFYLTAPYGKFVHFLYRYLALVKHAQEHPAVAG